MKTEIRLDQIETILKCPWLYMTTLDTIGPEWVKGRRPNRVWVQGICLSRREFAYDVDGELEYIRYLSQDYSIVLFIRC